MVFDPNCEDGSNDESDRIAFGPKKFIKFVVKEFLKDIKKEKEDTVNW